MRLAATSTTLPSREEQINALARTYYERVLKVDHEVQGAQGQKYISSIGLRNLMKQLIDAQKRDTIIWFDVDETLAICISDLMKICKYVATQKTEGHSDEIIISNCVAHAHAEDQNFERSDQDCYDVILSSIINDMLKEGTAAGASSVDDNQAGSGSAGASSSHSPPAKKKHTAYFITNGSITVAQLRDLLKLDEGKYNVVCLNAPASAHTKLRVAVTKLDEILTDIGQLEADIDHFTKQVTRIEGELKQQQPEIDYHSKAIGRRTKRIAEAEKSLAEAEKSPAPGGEPHDIEMLKYQIHTTSVSIKESQDRIKTIQLRKQTLEKRLKEINTISNKAAIILNMKKPIHEKRLKEFNEIVATDFDKSSRQQEVIENHLKDNPEVPKSLLTVTVVDNDEDNLYLVRRSKDSKIQGFTTLAKAALALRDREVLTPTAVTAAAPPQCPQAPGPSSAAASSNGLHKRKRDAAEKDHNAHAQKKPSGAAGVI